MVRVRFSEPGPEQRVQKQRNNSWHISDDVQSPSLSNDPMIVSSIQIPFIWRRIRLVSSGVVWRSLSTLKHVRASKNIDYRVP
jgi:hypothetical protein